MEKHHHRLLDAAIALFLVGAVAMALLIARGILLAAEAETDLANRDGKSNATATAKALDTEFGAMRHLARLFVAERKALLQDVAAARDPNDHIFDLAEAVSRWFPHSLAFTIVDGDGVPLVTDFKNGIGPVCLADLKLSAAGKLDKVTLHATAEGISHVDIVAPLTFRDGRRGSFMVSFTTTGLAGLMSASGDSRFVASLVPAHTPAGSNEYLAPVPATDLAIKARLDPKFLDVIDGITRRDLLIYVGGFSAFALFGASVLLWMRRRLRRASPG
jgi:hypothetical protein